MNKSISKKPAVFLVLIAFGIVYVVWGSTYFFIQIAVQGFPPMLLGALRFITAGILLLSWCFFRGEKLWIKKDVITSAITGLLLLLVANGIVIYTEQNLPSAMVAILVSANPIWVVVIDKVNWKTNLGNKTTIAGIVLGFAGVLLLFGEALSKSLNGSMTHAQLIAIILLLAAPVAWASGSLFAKKRGGNLSSGVSTSWQMLAAGIAFLPMTFIHHEYGSFSFSAVPTKAWLALAYLIIFGSIAAFSAYVWLIKVRPTTQVSTHSYVNPLIAVLLGVFFGSENISLLQFGGLLVILVSVLLVNLSKYSFYGRLFHKSNRQRMHIGHKCDNAA